MTHQLIHFCVLYGNGDHLNRLFASYSKQNFDFKKWPVHLVIVNNNESGQTPPAYEFPVGIEFTVLNVGKNLGYFGAVQFAIQKISPREGEWVAVSNSDLEFETSDFFEKLRQLKIAQDVAVLAPKIKSDLTKHEQNPYMLSRPSSRRMQFLKAVFASDVVSLAYQSLGVAKNAFLGTGQPNLRSQEIYAPHGSFILFHRNYFLKGLDFAHPPFLYGEEITVAERVREVGLKTRFEPSLRVLHHEHQATGKIPNRRMRAYIRAASHYLADRYFS